MLLQPRRLHQQAASLLISRRDGGVLDLATLAGREMAGTLAAAATPALASPMQASPTQGKFMEGQIQRAGLQCSRHCFIPLQITKLYGRRFELRISIFPSCWSLADAICKPLLFV
uniref:Uncharacterized protein n=1 Tax=Arundo donax TaxID=35708 RepID=A0A0A9H4J3_ARUDO